MRPLVFLDMDDVVCLDDQYQSSEMLLYFQAKKPDSAELWEHLVSATAAENLLQLHIEFSPVYIISSSWATFLSREQMCEALTRTGLEFVVENLHEEWRTPRALSSSRRDEIEWWLDTNRELGQSFLVIDDTHSGYTLTGSYFAHEGHLVLCSAGGRTGFNSEKLEIARRCLRRQLGDEA